MFKKSFLSLALIVGFGFQCDVKANNLLNSDVQQISLESLGEHELEVLEQVLEQSPEIQELLEKEKDGKVYFTYADFFKPEAILCLYPIVTVAILSVIILFVKTYVEEEMEKKNPNPNK